MAINDNFWTKITKSDQYRAVNDLIVESSSNGNYYTLLVLSSIIIAAGILLGNSSILIGGMLVTPLLTPILLISLGITLGRTFLIKKTSKLLFKSIVVIFAVSFLFGLIFSVPEESVFFSASILNDKVTSAFLYFLVAFVSGIAATFAWIRKRVTNMLPGISIAVALVPPISFVGIFLAGGSVADARFSLMVFLLNLVGIIMGSMILFSMLRFYRVEDEISANIATMRREEAEEKKIREREKYENIKEIK